MGFEDDFFKTIVPWVRDVGEVVISPEVFYVFRAYQNLPQPLEQSLSMPTTHYCTVEITESASTGERDDALLENAEAELMETWVSRRQVACSVNVYGNSSFDIAERVRSSLCSQFVKRDYFLPGTEAPFDDISMELGFVNASSVRSFHELVQEKWRPRAQFDVNFNVLHEHVIVPVDRIDSASIGVEIKRPDDSTALSTTIDVELGD